MTVQSSSKSRFGTYLKYRIGELKLNLVACCLLNVLALPLYALAANAGLGGVVSDFAAFGQIFSIMSVVVLTILAISGAALSFNYYNKKNLTDTIGVLPLTYRERFFADLLAGYITNVSPMIPCGIFCMAVFAGLQGKFNGIYPENTAFSMAGFGALIVISMFLIVTFAYLFSALMSACCGTMFHTVLFTIFAAGVLPLFSGGLARCVANGIVGVNGKEIFAKGASFFPPFGLFMQFFGAYGLPFKSGIDYKTPVSKIYTLLDPLHIVVYVITFAVLLALAYFAGKNRLAERTGSKFTVKNVFIAICVGITSAVVFMTLGASYYEFDLYLLVSGIVGAVIFILTVLLVLPKKRELLRTIICGAAAIGVSLVVGYLLNATGSFGARYLPEDAEKIEYVLVEDSYKITKKDDIAKYLSLLNQKLRDFPFDMQYEENWYTVEIKTESGKTIRRDYSDHQSLEYWGNSPILMKRKAHPPELYKLMSELDGYVDYFFDSSKTDFTQKLQRKNQNRQYRGTLG